jgi:hypothetical protein
VLKDLSRQQFRAGKWLESGWKEAGKWLESVWKNEGPRSGLRNVEGDVCLGHIGFIYYRALSLAFLTFDYRLSRILE